jgi:hypothetical protein
MCLLIAHPKVAEPVSDAWIKDFYESNPDGMGVMYAEDGHVQVHKCLPATPERAIQFWRKHVEGRDCAVHFRMATHGHIDMANCHPYQIEKNLWLMHNGILDIGNTADKTRSDTWHYIQTVFKPLIDPEQGGSPKMVFNPAVKSLVEESIYQSNKFIVLDGSGQCAIYNREEGVLWKGMWLSNTYAWSSKDADFKYCRPARLPRYTPSTGSKLSNWKDEDDEAWDNYKGSVKDHLLPVPYNNDLMDQIEDEEYEPLTPKQLKDEAMGEEVVLALENAAMLDVTEELDGADLEGYALTFSWDAVWELFDMLCQKMISQHEFIDMVLSCTPPESVRVAAGQGYAA